MKVTSIDPAVALPGGLVRVTVDEELDPTRTVVKVGAMPAEIVGAAHRSFLVRVPETLSGDVLVKQDGQEAIGTVGIGRVFAEELHPVGNPVVDDFGNVYVTLSGSRGEEVPFGVFVVSPSGSKQPFLGDIVNPSGLAIGPDGMIYVSSRHLGVVYRSTFDRQVEKFVEGLGIATGLAFDSEGRLLVGDRSGRIYRVAPDRTAEVLCELEPSISAYHLAVGPGDVLYVTGPTLASQDAVWRVDRDGNVEVFFRGFGRPQGLAFDSEGRLCVAASYRGWKGIFRLEGKEEPEYWIAGPMLVGLTFSPDWRRLYVVDTGRLYLLEI